MFVVAFCKGRLRYLGEIIDQVLSDSMNHYGFLRNHISSLHGRFVAEIFPPFFFNQTYRPLQVRLLNLIGLTDFCEKECRNDIYGDLLGLVFYRIIYVCLFISVLIVISWKEFALKIKKKIYRIENVYIYLEKGIPRNHCQFNCQIN